MYEPKPISKVVGYITVSSTLSMNKEKLWSMTANESGIDKSFYMQYFSNSATANAFQIDSYVELDQRREISEFGFKSAPQGYFIHREQVS